MNGVGSGGGLTSRETPTQALRELLRPDNIRCGARAVSWQDAVELVGCLLRDGGYTEERYTQAMRDLIEREGPYLVVAPGIALLHARPADGVLAAGIAVVTLTDPVPFGHSVNDPVWLLIGLAAMDDRSHVTALTQIATVLEHAQALDRLRAARTARDVLLVLTASYDEETRSVS